MDALILAAGRGTRLGTIGETTPKALLDIAGRTILDRVAEHLVAAGADRLIINISHHADQIEAFLAGHDLGAPVLLSRERPHPLETGGGPLHARALFRRDRSFFVHNVDVWTDADLTAMLRAHEHGDAIATVAVHQRTSTRQLLFDSNGLYGRLDVNKDVTIQARPTTGASMARAFAGIHVIAPTLLDRITERGVFSIMDSYLRLAGERERIAAYPIDGATWLEIGTPERLDAARKALRE